MFSGECLTELGPDEHKLENERRRETGPWLGRERDKLTNSIGAILLLYKTRYISHHRALMSTERNIYMMNLKILS